MDEVLQPVASTQESNIDMQTMIADMPPANMNRKNTTISIES